MKIVIATGGTGGHLFPALKVADRLKEMKCEVLFMGSFGANADKIKNAGYVLEDVGSQGVRSKSITEKTGALFSHVRAIKQSKHLLSEYQPNAVMGFGGYGAFPVVLAGRLLGMPTMIHEQNVVPGMANKILAVCVKRIAISFEASRKYLNNNKVILTGCPCKVEKVNRDKNAILDECGLKQGKKTILIFGGSQGSSKINREMLGALKLLRDEFDIQAFHITGKNDYVAIKEAYASLGIPSSVHEFYENMNDAYCVADLVVGRAGACTVTEVALAEVPAVLIPYPYAGGHQMENAKVLSELELAVLIKEELCTAGLLNMKIAGFLQEEEIFEKRKVKFKNIQNFGADKKLAQRIMELSR